MRASLLWTAALAAVLVLAGCNKAASPEKVDSDVAKATAAAEKKDERAQEKEARTDAALTNDAVTQAEGENKIALAKCEALAGDVQKACKDRANAQLDLVKQRAKALKADSG
jgi:hypothetical protein